MRAPISASIKRTCVERTQAGETAREVYNGYFSHVHEGMSYDSFRRKLKLWKKKQWADDDTLCSGTYAGFTAHNATVQVNAKGEITQAWIKQKADEEEQYQRLIDTIIKHTPAVEVECATETKAEKRMLEIGLYDMHFGLANDYTATLAELTEILCARRYEEINIILGQDMFHNDDFRGRTTKGTQIEKVDIAKAWEDTKAFWVPAIKRAIASADIVRIAYVKGNHDETLSWAFVQLLKTMFPQVRVDDGTGRRKCIFWNGCFVGLTHGCETKASPADLRGQFTIQYPVQFAAAKVREIHCGHLHHEREADIYGVMIRRLSTANVEDAWSDDNGFVGAHKRFMVFEWAPNRLKTIHYIDN